MSIPGRHPFAEAPHHAVHQIKRKVCRWYGVPDADRWFAQEKKRISDGALHDELGITPFATLEEYWAARQLERRWSDDSSQRNATMKSLEETIAWTMMYCQHYNPLGDRGGLRKTCDAGVEYGRTGEFFPIKESRATEDKARPCINGHLVPDALARCPKWIRKTREQGIARHQEIEEALERMRVVGPIVAQWREKLPIGKEEVIECPACKGRLHLSQAACNGHVHGHCETPGCVSWME